MVKCDGCASMQAKKNVGKEEMRRGNLHARMEDRIKLTSAKNADMEILCEWDDDGSCQYAPLQREQNAAARLTSDSDQAITWQSSYVNFTGSQFSTESHVNSVHLWMYLVLNKRTPCPPSSPTLQQLYLVLRMLTFKNQQLLRTNTNMTEIR